MTAAIDIAYSLVDVVRIILETDPLLLAKTAQTSVRPMSVDVC